MPDPQAYWLAQWLDQTDIKSTEDARRALRTTADATTVFQLASEAAEVSFDTQPGEPVDIVAGRQIDLSGLYTCNNPDCLRSEVDSLFQKTWHYFNHIAVEALGPRRFVREFSNRTDPDLMRRKLLLHVDVLLYLRDIGADKYLLFREKPHAWCATHYREHALELGLPAGLDDDLAQEIVSHLATEGKLESVELPDGRLLYLFIHPDLDASPTMFEDQMPDGEPDLQEIAKGILSGHVVGEIGDVALAKSLEAPLATTVDRVLRVGAARQVSRPEGDVALSIRLPVLQGVSARELIRLREDKQPEFEKFRGAMSQAIKDKVERHGDEDPRRLAEEIAKEFVSPALADIEVQLQAARRSLIRKTSQNIAVGGVATTVGVLGAMPLLVASGVAAAAGSVLHANKYVEAKQAIEMEDLYFLWHAAKKHPERETK